MKSSLKNCQASANITQSLKTNQINATLNQIGFKTIPATDTDNSPRQVWDLPQRSRDFYTDLENIFPGYTIKYSYIYNTK